MKLVAVTALTLLAALSAGPTALAAGSDVLVGDATRGKGKAATCGACHGGDGNSAVPMWPKIAGQGERYFVRQVHAIKTGEGRSSAEAKTMMPIVANLSDQDIADLAAYYAGLEGSTGEAAADQVDAGEKLYRAGSQARGVPACMSCHGPDGAGNEPAGFPQVAGQHAQYSAQQLMAYRKGERTTDPSSMMRTIAARMSDADIEAVAQYMQGLHSR